MPIKPQLFRHLNTAICACSAHMRAMRYSNNNKAESAKATAIKTSDSLKDTLKAFNYNCNCTTRDKTTLRRRPAIVALALSND